MGKPIHDFTNAEHWFFLRDSYMLAARKNMEALMRPTIIPAASFVGPNAVVELPAKQVHDGLDRNHPDVVAANASWVSKARRAHKIAMRREPLFRNFALTQNGHTMQGAIYVQARQA